MERNSQWITVLDDRETYSAMEGSRIIEVPEERLHEIDMFLAENPTGGTDLKMLAESTGVLEPLEDPRMEAWRRLQDTINDLVAEDSDLLGMLEPTELSRWEEGMMPADELLTILGRTISTIPMPID